MNVLLCSTYELGHQPLALAEPAAHILEAGFQVQCRDLAVQPLERGLIDWADVVAISVPMHTAIRLGVRLGEQIKSLKPAVHLCYYGLYASINARYLRDKGADSIIGGEFETPLVALLHRLAGRRSPAPEGIQLAGDLDVKPFLGRQQFLLPARHLLPPLERYTYLELGDQRKLAGYLEASRGCAHKCLHCPIPAVYDGRVRIVQEEIALADIRQLVSMGARHIDFGDPDFLNGVKHSVRIVERMHEEFPDLSFNFTTKIEHVVQHEEAIRTLAGLGLVFITSAVEALSDHILDRLEKGHTEDDVRRAKRIADDAGFVIRPTFVAFTPWTALDDYIHVMDVVEEIGWIGNVAPVQYAIRLLVPPGSCLLGKASMTPHLGDFDEEHFTFEWKHPDPRMDWLCARVGEMVADAERRQEDPALTFYRIKNLALQLYREGEPARIHIGAHDGRPVPKLSEQWFCCAEPTENQFELMSIQ